MSPRDREYSKQEKTLPRALVLLLYINLSNSSFDRGPVNDGLRPRGSIVRA